MGQLLRRYETAQTALNKLKATSAADVEKGVAVGAAQV
jgi:hypothetical protein